MEYAVIMAGGSGQRLWPLSRKNRPKQIIDVFEGRSLLRNCVDRISAVFAADHILVVTNQEYADVVRKHLPELPPENILGEPVGRDTANAIGLAATVLDRRCPNCVMAVFSADQVIEPVEPLHEAIRKAFRFLQTHTDALFTFGIKAAFAHTGYGYLKRGPEPAHEADMIYPVTSFEEKPNRSTASKYIRSGDYCWNSGMFVWRVDTILKQLETFLPGNAACFREIGEAWDSATVATILAEKYNQLEKISIDFGVMEQAEKVYMCELDCQWMDVGSYQSLSDTIGVVDDYGNVTTANTLSYWLDCNNNLAISTDKDHLIAAIHVEDLVVVHTDDATLICHRDETENLKKLLKNMQDDGMDRYI